MVVSACSIYAGSWLEGGGAVWAENQALRWLSDLAGLPPEAGGCFVSGGTMGNLSALVAARHAALPPAGRRPSRPVGGRHRRVRPRVGEHVRPGHGRGAGGGARRAPHRRRPPARSWPRWATGRARWWPPPAPPTWAWSTTWRRWPTPAPRPACGSTSTAPTGWRRWPRRRPATASPASSGPTRSSSTPTSGCSPPSTPAPCSTATRRGQGRPRPARGLPRRAHRERRLEPVRLRRPPHPPGAGAAVLVLPGRQRHPGLRRRRRALPHHRPGRGRPVRAGAAPGAGGRARAVGRGLPPPGMGGGRLRGLVPAPAGVGPGLRRPLHPRRRDDPAPLHRQPPHHRRRRGRGSTPWRTAGPCGASCDRGSVRSASPSAYSVAADASCPSPGARWRCSSASTQAAAGAGGHAGSPWPTALAWASSPADHESRLAGRRPTGPAAWDFAPGDWRASWPAKYVDDWLAEQARMADLVGEAAADSRPAQGTLSA